MRLLLLLLIALGASAQTNRTVTVRPSGGNYTSLSAALTGEAGDLVALNRQLTIELYAMEDTAAATIASASWTTDATRYILITVPTAERHAGVYTTSKYRLTNSGAAPLSIANSVFVVVDGLQVYTTANNHSPVNFITGSGAAANQTIRNCIIRGNTNVSSKGLINGGGTSNSSRNIYIYNNLIYDSYRVTGSGRGIQIDVVGNWYVWNNTLPLVGQGLLRNNGVVIAVNNLISATSATASGTFAAGTNYNATTLSTMGYTVTGGGNANDRTSQTFTFAGAGTGDYHLAGTDTGAKDFGMTNPGAGVFSHDIDGEPRNGAWDIGADEYPSAGRRRNIVIAQRMKIAATGGQTD
ncbi:MAG: hypothetical protein C0504_05175 [Candidatus Solibacter sp.]|nr:hypothetical protein [Candidatus Solibacter sp.]